MLSSAVAEGCVRVVLLGSKLTLTSIDRTSFMLCAALGAVTAKSMAKAIIATFFIFPVSPF
jgi:hypothetical protein